MTSASFYLPNQFMSFKHSSTTLPPPKKSQFRVSAIATAEKPSSTSSLYEVLGIQMGATSQEIKTAYRTLARTTHPDVASSKTDEFIRVHAAYSTLSDPHKRADYDKKLFWGARTTRIVSKGESGIGNYSARTRNWETDQCW